MIVLLDSAPVGLLAHSRFTDPPARECNEWAEALLQPGHRVVVPGIVDYELRRELNRMENQRSLLRLDQMPMKLGYHAVSAAVLHQAAHFWAMARRAGRPTADRQRLDIDMILAGHAAVIAMERPYDQIVIATTNVRHLQGFADARQWTAIAP